MFGAGARISISSRSRSLSVPCQLGAALALGHRCPAALVRDTSDLRRHSTSTSTSQSSSSTSKPRSGAGGGDATQRSSTWLNLQGVKTTLAVASCKGGVGKSSITVNLAYILAQMGYRVGILDADIYGPSLPFMIPFKDPNAGTSNGSAARRKDPYFPPVRGNSAGDAIPLEFEGVKLMSMGFLRPGQAAAMRGPMVSGVVQQLLKHTVWGELDYLLLDMPPGTGDIHLTIGQSVAVDAALMVTTPQQLSLVDVEKGIRMFDTLKIPTVGIVENMSVFHCPRCHAESSIYFEEEEGVGRHARSPARYLSEMFGIENFHQMPIDPKVAREGQIFALAGDSTRPAWVSLRRVAEKTTSAVCELLQQGGAVGGRPELTWEKSSNEMVYSRPMKVVGDRNVEVSRSRMPARELRLLCRGATMWHEFTGEKLFNEEDIASDVHPTSVEAAGQYAVSIAWSDRHSSLFPFAMLDKHFFPEMPASDTIE